MKGISLVLLFLTYVFVNNAIYNRVNDPIGCYTQDGDCNGCINYAESGGSHPCGICGETGECLPGSPEGPTLGFDYSFFEDCPNRWQHQDGSMIVQELSGYPVDPRQIDIYFVDDDSEGIDFTVTVTRPLSDSIPIDFVVIQDSSASMVDDMSDMARLVPKLLTGILATYKDSYYGYVQFIEKARVPHSGGNTYSWSLATALTNKPEEMLFAAAKAPDQNIGNIDWCEDAFTAIYYTLKCPEAMGFRDGSRKIAFIASDACFHEEEDTENFNYESCHDYCGKNYYPYIECECDSNRDNCKSACNDYDDHGTVSNTAINKQCLEITEKIAGTNGLYNGYYCPYTMPKISQCDPDPDGTGTVDLSDRHLWGRDVGYPNRETIKEMMIQNNMVPIFGIEDSNGDFDDYEDLVEYFGFGTALLLDGEGSSETLVAVLLEAIEELAGRIQLIDEDQPTFTISYLDPNPPEFEGVGELESRDFNINIKSLNPDERYINIIAIGFGTTEVRTHTSIPCIGCDGEEDSTTYTDLCGVCEPTFPDDCLGCDGIPNSGAGLDRCDVCGGDDLSCAGCDGIPNSGKSVDLCGVCGGNNLSCAGCNEDDLYDGSVVDACGVCGGNNSCVGCDGNIYPDDIPVSVDLCGVCNGSNSCLGCDGVPYSGAVDDACGVCNGTSDCIGCDGLKYADGEAPKDFDECGICGGDSSTCLGCDGVPNGQVFDQCGVCGGTDDCVGCDGIPNSGAEYDDCSICQGNNECHDCNGVPYGQGELDFCGVCDGDNECFGCDGVAFSGLVLDACGTCNGTNSSCIGCDGVPLSGAEYDACDVCGGNNSCLEPPEQIVPPVVEVVPTGVIVAITAALVTIAAVAAAAGIFFTAQTIANPTWYLLGNTTGATVHANPIFQNAGRNVQNALYEGGAGAGGDGAGGAGGDGAGGNGGADDSS
eukprot:TRINITY_DN195_c0_g1_i1.p1 TRINITY_DN195_c0_g1~~TRINITY_DN195_c0_g1_i1.p1  ORF type:complete len:933 (-),score=278.66 TRINITY_DN195_c0_g1_i1:109-2907(-)